MALGSNRLADWLPARAQHLSAPDTIALLQAIARHAVATPLPPAPIATAWVHQPALPADRPASRL